MMIQTCRYCEFHYGSESILKFEEGWDENLSCILGKLLVSLANYSFYFLLGLGCHIHIFQVIYTYAYYYEEVVLGIKN